VNFDRGGWGRVWGKNEVPGEDAGGGCSGADGEEGGSGLDERFSGAGIGVGVGIRGPLGDESGEPFDGVGLLEGVEAEFV